MIANFRIKLDTDRVSEYVEAIQYGCSQIPNARIVVIVVPNDNKTRYDAIKKLCCIDQPGISKFGCYSNLDFFFSAQPSGQYDEISEKSQESNDDCDENCDADQPQIGRHSVERGYSSKLEIVFVFPKSKLIF